MGKWKLIDLKLSFSRLHQSARLARMICEIFSFKNCADLKIRFLELMQTVDPTRTHNFDSKKFLNSFFKISLNYRRASGFLFRWSAGTPNAGNGPMSKRAFLFSCGASQL
jgi:hypothetical protein